MKEIDLNLVQTVKNYLKKRSKNSYSSINVSVEQPFNGLKKPRIHNYTNST